MPGGGGAVPGPKRFPSREARCEENFFDLLGGPGPSSPGKFF